MRDVIFKLIKIMNIKKKIFIKSDKKYKEAELLSLKIDKSKKLLKWRPRLSFAQTIEMTAKWYQCYLSDKKNIDKYSAKQVKNYFYD